MSLGFLAKIRFSQDQVQHGGTEGTEREIYFFRPSGDTDRRKERLKSSTDTAFFMGQFSKTLEQEEYLSLTLQMVRSLDRVFCLSVSPDKQKYFSVFFVPLW